MIAWGLGEDAEGFSHLRALNGEVERLGSASTAPPLSSSSESKHEL